MADAGASNSGVGGLIHPHLSPKSCFFSPKQLPPPTFPGQGLLWGFRERGLGGRGLCHLVGLVRTPSSPAVVEAVASPVALRGRLVSGHGEGWVSRGALLGMPVSSAGVKAA